MPREILYQISALQEEFAPPPNTFEISRASFPDIAKVTVDNMWAINNRFSTEGLSQELIDCWSQSSDMLFEAARDVVGDTLERMKHAPHPAWDQDLLIGSQESRRLTLLESRHNGYLELKIAEASAQTTIKFPMIGYRILRNRVIDPTIMEIRQGGDEHYTTEDLIRFRLTYQKISRVEVAAQRRDSGQSQFLALGELHSLDFSRWANYHH